MVRVRRVVGVVGTARPTRRRRRRRPAPTSLRRRPQVAPLQPAATDLDLTSLTEVELWHMPPGR